MNGQEILESFMPSEFPLESFELVKIEKIKNTIWSLESQLLYPHRLFYYFEEKDILPKWYEKKQLLSKGFTEYKHIYDLPLRNNFLCVMIKRRRWLFKETGKVISSNFEITETWTKNSKDLAFFLNWPMTDFCWTVNNFQI